MGKFTLLVNIALAALAANTAYGAVNQVPLPTIDLDEWWGPGASTDDEDTCITSFKIQFEDSMITDLKSRLSAHRRFTPPLEGVAFTYGFNTTTMEEWIHYVLNGYEFHEREQFLNQFPHYKTSIQGLNIHFMRVTSKDVAHTHREVVPLLLLHGWPGSIREFYETIPCLLSYAAKNGFSLDIIVPSLPGYGYSDGTTRPGLGGDKVAVIMRNLMHRLGYTQYYVQGGDFGSVVGSTMATYFPDEVLGYHTNFPFLYTSNMIFGLIAGTLHMDEVTTPNLLKRIYPLSTTFFNLLANTGFVHEQATKPDTVGIGLSDSPSGLIGYLLEKFTFLVRKQYLLCPDGCLTKVFTAEQLIDNVMIYWSTNSITTSMRLYAETINMRFFGLRLNEIKSPVPTRVIQAPDEMIFLPGWMIKQKFPNLLDVTLPSEGGHFYAWEKPDPFAKDVVDSIIQFKKWHAMNSTLYTQCSSYINY